MASASNPAPRGLFGAAAAERLRRFAVSLYAAPDSLSVEAFCAMLAARGIGGIGLTARAVQAHPPEALERLMRAHDLVATSLNSAGYWLHADHELAAAQAALDTRLLEAAQALAAPVNVIAGGTLHAAPPGQPAPDLRRARALAAEGLARLAERATRLGIRLSLEPMHPLALGTKGCINQVAAARRLAARHPSVGLTLDFYHSWWDEDLDAAIREAPQDILVAQVCGLHLPADGAPPRRAELAAGPADLALMLRALDAAGFARAIEYEVFWDQLGGPDPGPLLDRATRDFLAMTAG